MHKRRLHLPAIRDILKELNIRFYEHGDSPYVSEGWIGTVCCYCGREGKPGLGIHLQKLSVSCWKCGSHGKWLPRVLSDLSDRPIPVILNLLAGLDTFIPGEAKSTGRYLPPKDAGPLLPAHVRYLKNRGFDPDELVQTWGLSGVGISDEYQWRVVAPVTLHNRPVSWSTRAIGNAAPKYLSAPPDRESVPLKDTIFGMDHVRHAILIVEGWLDVMAVGPGVGGTYGLKVTTAQLLLLSKIPVRYICSDAEPAAQRQAKELAANLSIFPGRTEIVSLETGKDPPECSESERKELRKLLE